jgi:hypothetical protein
MGAVWLVATGAGTGLVALAFALLGAVRPRWLLVGSLLGSISALFLVTGWLLADSRVSKADALKTGGLAGGAILALYALWINDRRRQTEEARQHVERERAEQDRERISDERFARAVELLGHEADQVRVGALHALAGLARGRRGYTQTVLDVLCSYLCRPFNHPSYEARPDDPQAAEIAPTENWPVERIAIADRERQVRLTAQRLLFDLLPSTRESEPAHYHLDLTEAYLEYFDLRDRFIGEFIARRARLHGITRLAHIRVHGQTLFSGAVFHGRTDLYKASLDGGLSLLNARFDGLLRVPHATVRGRVDLRTAPPAEHFGTLTIVGQATVRPDEITGWPIQYVSVEGQPHLSRSERSEGR